jgi:hypothetical protein
MTPNVTTLHVTTLLYYFNNCAKALSIGVNEFIVSLNPTMPPIRKSLYSMVVSPLNSMIPSSPSKCSSLSSSLDSMSSGICHGFVNM